MFEPLEALLPEMRDLLAHEGQDEGVGSTGGPGSRSEGRDKPDAYIYPEQLRLWESVYELLMTISARTPLLIVLDDVQWRTRAVVNCSATLLAACTVTLLFC